MNEIDKTKIGFAVAILASLFTFGPLLNENSTLLSFWGWEIKLRALYWCFAGLLALAVYCYALTLIRTKKVYDFFQLIGNWIYGITLLFPLFIIVIYLISLLSRIAIAYIDFVTLIVIVEIILIVSSSVAVGIFTYKIAMIFTKEDRKQNGEQIRQKEMDFLTRANSLFSIGYYDLVVVELWNAIDLSIQRFFLQLAIPYKPFQLIETIKKNKLLDNDLVEKLSLLKKNRNNAAHGIKSIDKETAEQAILLTEKLFVILEQHKEECYYCHKKFSLNELEVEDLNGDYFVCKACAKEHPNWKDEILDLGMDP